MSSSLGQNNGVFRIPEIDETKIYTHTFIYILVIHIAARTNYLVTAAKDVTHTESIHTQRVDFIHAENAGARV